MKKEVFCKTVKEEVGKWNMALLTHKIFNQQRFDHHSIDELYPDPNVVSTII